MNLTMSDLQKSNNPAWRKAAGGLPDAKPRAKRFTGPTAQSKEWVREMSKGPGRFFQTGRMPNWLNTRGSWRKWQEIKKRQKWLAYAETAKAKMMAIVVWFPPFSVTLTRYGPKVLDDDGLAASLKYFQDGVAKALNVDDGNTSKIRWTRKQETARWWGLRIVVVAGV